MRTLKTLFAWWGGPVAGFGLLVVAGVSSGPAAAQAPGLPQLGKAPLKEVLTALPPDEKVQLVMDMGFYPAGFPPGLLPLAMPGDDKVLEKVPGAAGRTHAVPRLGIPSLTLSDGPAGVRIAPIRGGDSTKTYYATAFPVATLLASSWDTALVHRVGVAFGSEVRAFGIDVLLAPGLNIHRNPLGGRNFEYYSEDPLVAGSMAAALVNGVESNGVGTSIKHFAVNNQEFNRMQLNSKVSERALREIYLRGFELAVKKAQPWTVMSSYNRVNGTYTSESPDLLTTLLRQEWGFKGLVMTDWYGGKNAEMGLDDALLRQQAGAADVAVVALGRSAGEGGDRKVVDDFALTAAEQALLKAVATAFHAQKKKMVVVLNVGGVIEVASWRAQADAILLAWQPGQEGGHAMADVLSGAVPPSGKLTTTFPMAYANVPFSTNFPGKELPTTAGAGQSLMGRPSENTYEEGIYVGYRYYNTFAVRPAYEFGYGLSYTTFAYSNLKLSTPTFDGRLTATVTVTNRGAMAGKEAVQLYLSAPVAKLDKPESELKAFAKTSLLRPGQAQTLSFTLTARDLASYDAAASAWVAEAGTYTVKLAASSRNVRQSANFRLPSQQMVAQSRHLLAPQTPLADLKPSKALTKKQ